MRKLLVLGGHGQLGQCLRVEIGGYKGLDAVFMSSTEADIRNETQLAAVLVTHRPDVVINCAAYTAVDQAEDEPEAAIEMNATAVGSLARLCKAQAIFLVHISTDFVFSGERPVPLRETDITDPIGIYGSSKRAGEILIQQVTERYLIIRTSWLYSEYGHNFLKTMLRVGQEKSSLGVVVDQVGTPTYARDLAAFILRCTDRNILPQGIFHFSNEGVASWYDFAVAIFAHTDYPVSVMPLLSEAYPTRAKRPAYSVLDKSKAKKNLGISIDHWQVALDRCMQALKNQ